MNQILQVEDNKNEKKPSDKKIMIIFIIIIAIIVFGLIFVGREVYINYKNMIYPPVDNTVNTPKDTPVITLIQTEDNRLVIKVESKVGISKVEYNWNDGNVETMQIEGKNNIEKTINIPIGENTVYISVTDIDGTVAQKQGSFVIEVPKPVIDLSIVGNYIKISVTSEVELSTITYKWNSENQKTENMATYENRNEFEKKIEIPIGQNILQIEAIDINGTKTEKSQEIKGVTKATTKTEVKDGYLHFTVTGKENIKSVEFKFNGKKYIMNETTFGQTKVVHYKVKLIEGMNYLEITSKTQSDGVDTTSWEQEYKAK